MPVCVFLGDERTGTMRLLSRYLELIFMRFVSYLSHQPRFASSSMAAALLCAVLSGNAAAQERAEKWDMEIDPLAYALHGYSVHVGMSAGHLRYELGAYAADIPRSVHGNDGFDASMRGWGAKVQYFFADVQEGWFIGLGAGPSRERVVLRTTGERIERTFLGVGAEVGYRFELGGGFYATPWVGLDYRPRARDAIVGGKTFTDRRVTPFAAVHLGFRF